MAVQVSYTKFKFKVPSQISESEYLLARMHLHNSDQDYNPHPALRFKDVQKGRLELLWYTFAVIGFALLLGLSVGYLGDRVGDIIDMVAALLLVISLVGLIVQIFSILTSLESYRVYKRQHKNYYGFIKDLIIKSQSYTNYLGMYQLESKKKWI